MPGYSVSFEEVQPFQKDKIHCMLDFRISGTYRNKTQWSIDVVEVPGQAQAWIQLAKNHPLYTIGVQWAESEQGREAIEEEIALCLEDEINERRHQERRDEPRLVRE